MNTPGTNMKTSEPKPFIKNEVIDPPERIVKLQKENREQKHKKQRAYSLVFIKYLSTLSSTEKKNCLKDMKVALPGFKKFVDKFTDEEYMVLCYR